MFFMLKRIDLSVVYICCIISNNICNILDSYVTYKKIFVKL